jgi:uncharacterized caspase-like protein
MVFIVLLGALSGKTLAAQGLSGEEKRYALVIGNRTYTFFPRLANPANDAQDMKAALERLGFETELVLDGTLEDMEGALGRFASSLENSPDAIGFFYYAGHGVQFKGAVYLLPVNARVWNETLLRNRAFRAQSLYDMLEQAGNRLNVLVFDACRDNPLVFPGAIPLREGEAPAFAVDVQPPWSIVVFASEPGAAAADGPDGNGLFTSALLKNLETDGLEIRDVFGRTSAELARISGNTQVPVLYARFRGTVYLTERRMRQ